MVNFYGIIGQKEIVGSLENSIRHNRVGHAYVFSGSRGIGKKTVAKIFAGLLLCSRLKNIDSDTMIEPCDECMSCQMFQNGSNPDFQIIESDSPSIGIEDIRKLQSDIIIKPLYSARKVYLITEAQKMTIQAQNCLLKTLEEPPEYAVIILTTSNYDALMETIRSRTTRYSFKKNTSGEIRRFLEGKYGDKVSEIDFIVSYSDGIIGTALELAESNDFSLLRKQAFEIVLKLNRSKLFDVFEVYDFFESNKANIDDILDIMTLFYRDFIAASKGAKENILINSDKKDIIFSNVSSYTMAKLIKCIDIIQETRRNIKQNANYQLAIEIMLIKLQEE